MSSSIDRVEDHLYCHRRKQATSLRTWLVSLSIQRARRLHHHIAHKVKSVFSVFVVHHDVVTDSSGNNGVLAVVVTNFSAISRHLHIAGIARRYTNLNVDASTATAIPVAGICNLNDRGNSARRDVSGRSVTNVREQLQWLTNHWGSR